VQVINPTRLLCLRPHPARVRRQSLAGAVSRASCSRKLNSRPTRWLPGHRHPAAPIRTTCRC